MSKLIAIYVQESASGKSLFDLAIELNTDRCYSQLEIERISSLLDVDTVQYIIPTTRGLDKMNDRITIQNVEARCERLNEIMFVRNSIYRYSVGQGNGYAQLYRYLATDGSLSRCNHVLTGTKREVYEYLGAGINVLIDAATKS